MWNLTPDYLQQVKEELKGRRTTMQARHAEELKSLEADLKEIETLERVAYAVAVKHLPELEPATEQREPEPQVLAELEPGPQIEAEPGNEPAVSVGPEAAAKPGSMNLSRWRIRLDENSETESA